MPFSLTAKFKVINRKQVPVLTYLIHITAFIHGLNKYKVTVRTSIHDDSLSRVQEMSEGIHVLISLEKNFTDLQED